MTNIQDQRALFTASWEAQGKRLGWQDDGYPCGTPGVTAAWATWWYEALRADPASAPDEMHAARCAMRDMESQSLAREEVEGYV
jgi:hypothetical protein